MDAAKVLGKEYFLAKEEELVTTVSQLWDQEKWARTKGYKELAAAYVEAQRYALGKLAWVQETLREFDKE
jgi:hypothetical protein